MSHSARKFYTKLTPILWSCITTVLVSTSIERGEIIRRKQTITVERRIKIKEGGFDAAKGQSEEILSHCGPQPSHRNSHDRFTRALSTLGLVASSDLVKLAGWP
jgi:hypothetical protein